MSGPYAANGAPISFPGTRDLLEHFEFDHLAHKGLREISFMFHDLANNLARDVRLGGPEATVALRKLLEAKDAAVRSAAQKARREEKKQSDGAV